VRFFALDSNYMDAKQLAWLQKELQDSEPAIEDMFLSSSTLFVWKNAWLLN